MAKTENVVGWILGIVAVLMMIGQARVVNPILGFGFNVFVLDVTVLSVLLIIAAYYLIK